MTDEVQVRTEPPREVTWTRFPTDAMRVLEPKDAPSGRCRQARCQAPIWWGETAAHAKRCPFDIRPDGTRTGTSHWRTCRQRPTRSA